MPLFCLTVLVSLLTPYVATCPAPCGCSGSSVSCDNQSISAIPVGVPDNTTHLWARDNDITHLSADVFDRLAILEMLNLDNNLLQDWPPQVFTKTPLRQLSISHNKITLLRREMFANLITLQVLILSNNEITELQSGVFENLTNLESLFLHENNIQELPAGVFSGLGNLEVVQFSSNNLESISAEVLVGLNSLSILWLSSNRLQQLPETVFNNASIAALFLGRNSLTSLPAGLFTGCTQLFTLQLEHNNLTTLLADLFSGLPRINRLNLGHNSLTRLPSGIFNGLSDSAIVELGSNPWGCDCRLHSLARWIQNSSLGDRDLGSPTCSGPPHTLGAPLREMVPCQHGTCRSPSHKLGAQLMEKPGDDVMHACVCNSGWTGLYCQEEQRSAAVTTPVAATTAATAAAIVVALIVAASIFGFFLRQRRRRRRKDVPLKIDFFLPDDIEIHNRRLQEAPPVPPRPQFPGLEVSPSRVKLGPRIGRGAFGVVFRAELKRGNTCKDVAVKTLKDNASEEEKLHFMGEIRAVVDLGTHDNLLGLVGCCTLVGDHLYLITEFMSNGDLKNFLRKCREDETPDRPPDDIYTFQVLQMYQVARQIARGMDHIAQSRYIHGDLAARNVLVGEGLKVKISDFGLAEDMYSRGYRRQDRLKKVPWKWMAPERLQDGEAYTTASDVWSFGIVLYEITTLGGDPYPDIPSAELKDRLRAGYRMPKPDICTASMYDMMTQCWNWEPICRPSFRNLQLRLDKDLAFYGPEYATITPSS